MLLDGEIAGLLRLCVELSAGRFEGRGCRFLLIIHFAYFGVWLGRCLSLSLILSLVHTGPLGGPGVV